MRIGPIGPLWAQQFLAAAFWAAMAILWSIGNASSDIRPFMIWIAGAGAVIYAGRGIYALIYPSKIPPERSDHEEPDAAQMIIYVVLACTVLFAVYTGFWLFVELSQMQR
jgi:hypothetical protein